MTRAALLEPRDWCSLTVYCSRLHVSVRIAANLACSLLAAGVAQIAPRVSNRGITSGQATLASNLGVPRSLP